MRLYYLANVAQSQPNTGNLLIRQMRRTVKLLEYLSPFILSDTEAIIRNGQFHPLLIPKHYDIDIHFLSRIFDRILYQVRQDIRHMYRIGRQIRHIRGKGRRERDFFPGGDIDQAYHLLHQLTEIKSGRSQKRLRLALRVPNPATSRTCRTNASF